MKTKLTLTTAILLALGTAPIHAQDAEPSGWKSGSGDPDLFFDEADVNRDEMLDRDEYREMMKNFEASPQPFQSKQSIAGEEGPYDDAPVPERDLVDEDDMAASETLDADAEPEPFQSKSDIGDDDISNEMMPAAE